jgi:menaquinone-dependent protoporphyrinogen oxidase
LDVVNLNRTEQIAWQDYDRVVIGASIRYGHFIRRWIAL